MNLFDSHNYWLTALSVLIAIKLQGTGFGLSISRSIVESHCGRLWADDGAARGATFRIVLTMGAK